MNAIQSKKNFVSFALAALIAISVFFLTSIYFQNTTFRILITGHFTNDTLVTVKSIADNGKVTLLDDFLMAGGVTAKAAYNGTKVLNAPLRRLQLDFEYAGKEPLQADAALGLTSIQVKKPYQEDYYFGGERVGEYFESATTSDKIGNYYQFNDKLRKISIRSINPIGKTNWALILGLPMLFFIGFFLLIRNSNWLSIPAFADISLGNKISSSGEFDAINGLRGLAALLVLLSHTAPGFEATQMGLALLFVLSGFLLSKPFVIDNNKIFNWANIERYLTKRLKRILPMYYLYIFLVYVITFKFDTALRHFFFVQAEGHLWPMTQIFAFYMLLPIVLVITSLAFRVNRFLPIAILSLAIYFAITLLDAWTPFFNGLFSHKFFLYSFLMGVTASYIQYDLIGKNGLSAWGKRWLREIIGLAALVITFYVIAWSAPIKPSPAIFQWVSQFWVKCAASVAIILLALNTPSTFYRHIIANPLFRSVGVIGFSFYLLHGLGMQIFEQIQIQALGSTEPGNRSWEFTVGAFCVTYIMAVITYSYVERPFFGYREKK